MQSLEYLSKNEKFNIIYFHIKKMVAILPKRQFNFLYCWYELCGGENKEFGFPGEYGLKDQSKEAFKFLKNLDNQYNQLRINNEIDISFSEYFYQKAIAEGICLPTDFIEKIQEQLKILEDL